MKYLIITTLLLPLTANAENMCRNANSDLVPCSQIGTTEVATPNKELIEIRKQMIRLIEANENMLDVIKANAKMIEKIRLSINDHYEGH